MVASRLSRPSLAGGATVAGGAAPTSFLAISLQRDGGRSGGGCLFVAPGGGGPAIRPKAGGGSAPAIGPKAGGGGCLVGGGAPALRPKAGHSDGGEDELVSTISTECKSWATLKAARSARAKQGGKLEGLEHAVGRG